MTDISFKLTCEDGGMKLLLKNNGAGFQHNVTLIERTNGHLLEGQGYEAIYAILKETIEIPRLDQEEREYCKEPVSRIALYLERSLADELAERSSFSFDTSEHGDVLVAEREARP